MGPFLKVIIVMNCEIGFCFKIIIAIIFAAEYCFVSLLKEEKEIKAYTSSVLLK